MADILTDIEAFIREHEISDSQFGVFVLNDKNLIPQLKGEGRKRPRRLWPETEARVRERMAEYRPDTPKAA